MTEVVLPLNPVRNAPKRLDVINWQNHVKYARAKSAPQVAQVTVCAMRAAKYLEPRGSKQATPRMAPACI